MRRRRSFGKEPQRPPKGWTSPCVAGRERRFFLASFQPLVHTAAGRKAAETFGLPPFIDGSCRREPDLQGAMPSITALCRQWNFAPRLCEGDHVVYMTIKFGPAGARVRHLVAALKVARRFETHQAAKLWYAEQGEQLPSNCCVRGNPPVPVAKTSYPHEDLAEWNSHYVNVSNAIGVFLACERVVVRLTDPPILTDRTLVQIFKRIPCTQTPPRIERWQFDRLVALL